MKKYQIWIEGFLTQGGSSTASLLGEAEGKTFEDAVKNWYKENPSPTFDPMRLTEYGCKLYNNEKEARKRFG